MSKKKLMFLALFAIAGLNLTACTTPEHAAQLREGTYKKTVVYTDSSGAEVKRETYTDVDIDDAGHKKVVKKSKTTRDPKGLFNEETTYEHKKVIDEQ